ncbi:MAG: SDR family NAD(P)-dependent oxidoreductase [Gemmatimonadetes bacterium]|nr:SDR family NAD(P)-dependent oxidoreductase [Gemmatimonadota bacterium]
MEADRAVAIVGLGAILPDAPDVASFWANLAAGRYSISDVSDRWDMGLYYDPDPKAPDKTYSKIGGWVRDYEWNPMAWRMPIPPKVGDMMDPAQKWAVAASRQALMDYGYPERHLDPERVAVIVGNALGGDFHLLSAARILFPEVGDELRRAPSFQALPDAVRQAVMDELVAGVRGRIPDITEDTMPGELGNIVAGRVAALYDFKGPNYITDAACASAMAGMSAAVEGLIQGDYDAVLTGGIDANMSASTFVKFCKIGALSATGSRPYAEGADGFVMGEGASVFLLKRLADAERDGDKVYAVILASGGSSDGKGKGITAPNPAGQRFAVVRAWEKAGVAPAAGDLIEGHGTSTKVGDVAEVETLHSAFEGTGLPVGSLALGSVKSNIGHLKGGAGSAGVLKATLALYHKALPPSVNYRAPNPNIDFSTSPLRVNTELRAWDKPASNGDAIRRAGVSAFGFGGTNFHMVLEEYVPGRHRPKRVQVMGADMVPESGATDSSVGHVELKPPMRGALVVGGANAAEVEARLRTIEARAREGEAPVPAPPRQGDLKSAVRVAIDYADAAELADLAGKAVAALESGEEGRWRALRNKGVYRGSGTPGKVAFLFTGQGSQYVGMLEELRSRDEVVAATFDEADQVMSPVLGGPLSDRIFVDGNDAEAVAKAEDGLKQTAITQPAVLTVDTALARLFAEYGIEPDMVMGHSLGEYGALVAADAMDFGDALTAVAARGDAMTRLSIEDNGLMAAVFGPLEEVSALVEAVEGYVVVANVNSTKECVIGGATDAVQRAMEALQGAGYRVAQLPVSHAFHTSIVAPAAEPLRKVLSGMKLRSPRIPVVANVDASFYPTGADVQERIVDILGQQIGSPVQFVKGLNALYDAGARVFVEMGPKRSLYAMADDVVGGRDGVTTVFTNQPRTGDVVSVNRALCAFYALGLGAGVSEEAVAATTSPSASVASPVVRSTSTPVVAQAPAPVAPAPPVTPTRTASTAAPAAGGSAAAADRYVTLGRMFADFLDKSFQTWQGGGSEKEKAPVRVGITGAALGLPGRKKVFDEDNVASILRGDGYIAPVPDGLRAAQLDRSITRLVKGSNGEARFETIEDPEEVIKLAGRAGALDLVEEFGFPEDRVAALDWVTRLAIAAGIDALRDAGIPLVRRYKTTSTGSKLPVGWALPEEMREDTGIVFGSAFPGYDQFARAMKGYYEDHARRARRDELMALRARLPEGPARDEVDVSLAAVEKELDEHPFHFDRRFLFQVLSMGHSQFAEYIGARGPNIATNAACSTGTQAVGVAQDWIESGRCRRVLVVTADDVTTDDMFPWFASGFLASGSAATDARVEDAALPFDRRRHGLIIGMGGAALVVEDLDAAAERGVWPICEVMGTVVANSAFHGSRLDVEHIAGVMETLVSGVERRWGITRDAVAPQTVFVSHETYTPARGGSAGAEVRALREVFGSHANDIVVANTKGHTGHPMGVAIEDTLAVKMLETGLVPPVANYREVDPELGTLNLSRGGSYPVHFALRLAAGFGSQISMSLLRWTPPPDGARRSPMDLGFRHRVVDMGVWSSWLRRATGYDAPELEVVQHTLRVKDQGPPAVEPMSIQADVALRAPVPPTVVGAPAAAPQAPTPQVSPAAPAAPPPAAPTAAPPTPAPAAEAPSLAVEAAAAGLDEVAQRVLQIVAEQTGYPPDMLALDLDLEADLGIDTVKQAEMFAAIRAAYGIERDDNLALRDYPTLGRAIEFVYEKRPELKGASATAAAPAPETTAPATTPATTDAATAGVTLSDPVAQKVLAIVAEQTGYPPDMLALDLDLEADLGIDTVKQAEMFAAIRGAYDIERDDNLALRDYPTLGRAIEFVYEKRPDLTRPLEAAVGSTAAAATAAGAAPGAPSAAISVVTPPAAPARTPSAPDDIATAPVPSAASDPVAQKVLAIVAEQTGYPPDMLELDLDLEADLGIDTVKQAEMFAAIRAAYDIERDDNLALRDYPTLGRAIEFVYEKRPDLKRPSEAAGGSTAPAATAASPAPEAPAAATSVVAPPAAPTTAPAVPGGMETAAAPPSASDPVAQKVLAIVAEQTGYPPDMLELDLDLEADLGIDTVKQAEMFAAIRAAYDIERDDNLALRDYPTLGRAIEFVYEKRPELRPGSSGGEAPAAPAPSAPQAAPEPVEASAASHALARGSLEAAQSVPRREPVAQVRPPAPHFPTTGAELGEGSRVVVVPDEGGIATALADRLTRRGVEVFVADPSLPTEALVAEVEAWRGTPGITGVYWLPAMDPTLPAELAEPADRREALRRRVKALHALARVVYGDLAAEGSFFVSGTRLGGRHGYEPSGAVEAAGGAVTGFTKSLRRERPEALIKAVDFEVSRKTAALADLLIEETLNDPGAPEVGYAGVHRWAVGLVERPVEAGPPLPEDSVYLVTGAAGSIVSAILTDMAGAGGTFWLLDLAPEPDPANPDLARIDGDREGLRNDLIKRLQDDGHRVTPVMVEKELARIERAHAARAAIAALEAGGATVRYRSLDLRDPQAVASVVEEIVAAHGRVDVLLHAAGLEISRQVPDKSPEEFALVFDVKVEGWFNLLTALGDAPLGRVMAFSSIAGRFGNLGQTDYAAANDLLCKAMSGMRRGRPETRALAVDWTAWGEIGMAARGSMPAIMKAAGIDMLSPAAGMGVVRRELTAGSRGEVVIAEGLGMMIEEDDEKASLAPAFVEKALANAGPMVGAVRGWSLYDGLVVETELEPDAQPFLDHHRIEGTAVLPGVMGLEAMAATARVGFPEMHVTALERVEFHTPFKFYRDEPRTVTVRATFEADGDDVLARCTVTGARSLVGREEPEVTTHFTGTVRLSPTPPSVVRERAVPEPDGVVVGAPSIYRTYFHGPAYRVLERAWWTEGLVTGRFATDLPPNHEPEDRSTVTAPRLVELAFQTAGLAEIAAAERMGLPFGFQSLEILQPAGEMASSAVASTAADEGFDIDVADAEGRVLLSVRGYRTSALPGRVSLEVFQAEEE